MHRYNISAMPWFLIFIEPSNLHLMDEHIQTHVKGHQSILYISYFKMIFSLFEKGLTTPYSWVICKLILTQREPCRKPYTMEYKMVALSLLLNNESIKYNKWFFHAYLKSLSILFYLHILIEYFYYDNMIFFSFKICGIMGGGVWMSKKKN